MIFQRLLPKGMVARFALVLVAALAIEFAGNLFLNKWYERELLTEQRTQQFAEQLANADQVAAQVERVRRMSVMADMGVQGMTLNWVPGTVITDASAGHPQLARMRERLETLAPTLAGRDLRLSLIRSGSTGERDLLGALRLGDGSFVTFRIRPFLGSPPSPALVTVVHLLLVAVVLGVALLMVWALVSPLRRLAERADMTGRGATPDIGPDGPVDGLAQWPWEVRRVATAFGAMQARLLQASDDHTKALIAVSHDLRTPIQRLRLRAALLNDEDVRDAMSADLADMEKFIASVVGFMQCGAEEEERLVDVAAIVMTMVDNAADAGAQISYEGPDKLLVRLKPLAFKRVLGNLVDNACRHATHVCVTVCDGEPVVVSVDDNGPGIPASQREEAFVPYRRLGGQRANGSSGLGLAIARKAAATFGGTVILATSAMGGLSARVQMQGFQRDASTGTGRL